MSGRAALDFIPVSSARCRVPPPLDRHSLKRPIRAAHNVESSHVAWIPINKTYAPGVLGLHEEVEDFFQWMVPTLEEHELRLDVKHRIEAAVHSVWPAARVESFGSFRTGLYLPTSDIDLVIFGRWDVLPLRAIERLLIEHNIARPDSIKVLEKATVPIVKFSDSVSNMNVDISFNMTNCLRAVELIKHFKKCFPPLPKLIYVLKQFLLQRDLNEVFTGGLSSYALTLLVVSFLQLHPRENASAPNANLGVLLLEFFEHYGRNFNYLHTAIRIRDGGSLISKKDIQNQLPSGLGPGMMCIEDPLDPSNDVGRSSYGAMNVKQAFERAFTVLGELVRSPHNCSNNKTKSILSHIIILPPGVQEYRRWVWKTAPFLHFMPSLPTDEELAPPARSYVTAVGDVTPKCAPDGLFESHKRRDLHSGKVQNGVESETSSNDQRQERKTESTRYIARTRRESSHQSWDSECEVDLATDPAIASTTTPTSAMSISPASSEVGSLQSRLREASSKLMDASMMSLESENPSSKSRPMFWGGNRKTIVKGSNHHVDRSDLDSNWRSAPMKMAHHEDSRAKGNHVTTDAKFKKPGNPPAITRYRADKDTDWRKTAVNSISAKENEETSYDGKSSCDSTNLRTEAPSRTPKGENDIIANISKGGEQKEQSYDSCESSTCTTKSERSEVSRNRQRSARLGKKRKKSARNSQRRQQSNHGVSTQNDILSKHENDEVCHHTRFSSQCGLLKPNR